MTTYQVLTLFALYGTLIFNSVGITVAIVSLNQKKSD